MGLVRFRDQFTAEDRAQYICTFISYMVRLFVVVAGFLLDRNQISTLYTLPRHITSPYVQAQALHKTADYLV